MTISDDSRAYGKFADGAMGDSKKRYSRTVSISCNDVESSASMQEVCTLKAIRLTQL
jgi:hypothetical protein